MSENVKTLEELLDKPQGETFSEAEKIHILLVNALRLGETGIKSLFKSLSERIKDSPQWTDADMEKAWIDGHVNQNKPWEMMDKFPDFIEKLKK